MAHQFEKESLAMSATQSHTGGPQKFGVPLGSASKAHQKGVPLKNADTHNRICAMLCCFRKARRKSPRSLRQKDLDLCWPMCPVLLSVKCLDWFWPIRAGSEAGLLVLCSCQPQAEFSNKPPTVGPLPQSVRQLSRFRVVNITSGPVQSGVPFWWGDV